jgi:hypothetical protein
MAKSWNPLLAGMLLLILVSVASSFMAAPTAGSEAAAPEDSSAGTGHPPADGGYASEVPDRDIVEHKDGTLAADNEAGTIPVAQELDFVRDNSFRKPYDESLKSVAKVEYYGTRYVGCEQYSLEIHAARPNQISTLIKSGGSSKFESRKSNKGVKIHGDPQGLGVEEERALLETFDFDTPVVELEKNPHALKPLGMQKLPGMLTWKLEVDRPGGYHRILYVDSHFGDIVKFTIMSANGARVLDVTPHDYRSVEGIRVPFAIDYRSPDGTLLASDRLERVAVTRARS